jgi:peptidoglycan/LPS O-acetylase OafA/YrhL
MQKRFEVLDSFRGLAAIFVILYHLLMLNSITALEFFRNSNLFVEFFFVLSGFVLTHGYAFKDNLGFKNFFIARTFRIFPLHIVMLAVFILLEFGRWYASNHGFSFNTEPFTALNSPKEILPNLLLLQAWLPSAKTLSWNTASWSISVEYYMYMIFFLSLLLKGFLRGALWFLMALAMFIIIYIQQDNPSEVARGLACFYAGALVYLTYQKTYHKIEKDIRFFTLLEMLISTFMVFILSSNIEHKLFIASLFFCFQVYIFAFEAGYISQFLRRKFFLYLGKLSYSIYLTHSVILFITTSFLMIAQKVLRVELTKIIDAQRYIDLGNSFYNNLLVAFIIAVVIGISHLTYKYIEIKGQELGKKIQNLSKKKEEGIFPATL